MRPVFPLAHPGQTSTLIQLMSSLERARSRQTAKRIGIVNEITVGVEIWAHNDPTTDCPDRGGIVVDIDRGAGDTIDPASGEITRHPARYRCYQHRKEVRDCFEWVLEDDVDRSRVGVVQPATLSNAARRLALEAAGIQNRKRQRSGMLTPFEMQLIGDAGRLASQVMGGAA